jgi:hypothetical protein
VTLIPANRPNVIFNILLPIFQRQSHSDAPRKRYPFSSLLSSGNHTNRSRTKRNGAEVSVAASFREATSLRHRTTTAEKGPAESISTIAVAPTTSIRGVSATTSTTPFVGGTEAFSSDVDSDLLQFGASVEFIEDNRRHIHAETQELEAFNETTKEAVTKESRTEDQLLKNLDRAKSELVSLNQGAEDQLESAKMFLTLNRNLDGEFRSGILESTMPAAMTTCTNTRANTTQAAPSEINPSVPALHPITPDGRNQKSTESRPLSNKEILAKKESRADVMLHALKNETKSLEAARAKIRVFQEKRARLEESMESQGLEESLERAREDERRLQSELMQEQDAKVTRIVEIQHIRESCGAKAQQCTDLVRCEYVPSLVKGREYIGLSHRLSLPLTCLHFPSPIMHRHRRWYRQSVAPRFYQTQAKELSEAKKSNAKEEADLLQQVQTIQAEIEDLLKNKEESMLQIELEKRNLEKASKEMDDYHYYCKAKEDYEKAKVLRNERKKELLARQAEAKSKLEQTQEAEQASLLRKQQAEEAMRLAEAKKKENSETEINIVLPGKAELAKLAERKMKLAEQITEASKNAEREQAKEHEALAAKTQAKKDAIEQAEIFETKYKAKQEEIEATSKMHQEFVSSHNEQIAYHESLSKKFAEMHQAETEAYETRLREGRERYSEKILRHVEEQERIADAHAFKLDVFEQGILLLEDSAKVEREANDTN